MAFNKGMRSPARWAMLQMLADTGAPLTRAELTERTGLNRCTVIDLLKRPRNAGWVTAICVRIEHKFGSHACLTYQITDTGRRTLAEHAKES